MYIMYPDMGSNTWKCISIQIQISFKNTRVQILLPPKYLNTLNSISNTNTFFISTAFQTVMLKREMYKTNIIVFKGCWPIIALSLEHVETSFNFLRYSKMSEHTRLGFSSHDCEMKYLNIQYCLPVAPESSMSAGSMWCIFIAKITIGSMEQFYSSKDRCNSHKKTLIRPREQAISITLFHLLYTWDKNHTSDTTICN